MNAVNKSGVYTVEARKGAGRRKQAGSIGFVEGVQCVFLGYNQDYTLLTWMPMRQLKAIRGAVKASESKWQYRLLKKLLSRYEVAV